jgi:hypothetical protein
MFWADLNKMMIEPNKSVHPTHRTPGSGWLSSAVTTLGEARTPRSGSSLSLTIRYRYQGDLNFRGSPSHLSPLHSALRKALIIALNRHVIGHGC